MNASRSPSAPRDLSSSSAAGHKFGSLTTGIVIALCAGLLLPALIGGMALATLRQWQMNRATEYHLEQKLSLVATSLIGPLSNRDRKAASIIAEASLLDLRVVRISIIDPGLNDFLSIERPERRLGNTRVAGQALALNGELLGKVELEIDDGLSQDEFRQDRRVYFLVLLGQFVLALVLGLIALRRWVLKPLARLTAFSNQLASGNLDRPLDWKGTDEIGLLAHQMDQMRQGLRTSFAEQKVILDNVQVGVIFVRNGIIKLANRSAEEIFGYGSGEMNGLSTMDSVQSDEHFPAIGEKANSAIAVAGGRYEEELRLMRCDGTPFWARLRGCAIDSAAPYAESLWVIEDITERRRDSDQLRLAATVFENTADGVIITDRDMRIVAVNRGFEHITGYAAAEVIGKTPSVLESGLQPPEFYTEMWHELRENRRWRGELWNRRKNGENYPEDLTITAVFDSSGELDHYVGVFSDINFRKAAEDEIRYLAFYDLLTRLPNRRLMLDRLKQALISNVRKQRHGALMMIDLDNFKTLNDTQGHDVGDLLLVAVAARLQSCIRQVDTVARMGGDEFVVILEDLDHAGLAAMQAESVARKILIKLSEPFRLEVVLNGVKPHQHSHQCTSSIGITLFRDHSISVDELLKRADTAMYQAKAAGRNTLRFFDPDMQEAVATRVALELELRQAVDRGQFLLHFQPQLDAFNNVIGAEALLRWQRPGHGLVCPAEFISLLEESGLILAADQWVLEAACVQLVAWATRAETAHLTVAVNVSGRQFHHEGFVEQVMAALQLSGADPHRLKLELTENVLASDATSVIAKMRALKTNGVGLTLDDFGAGYSSLSYLKQLPLDELKIDQSFVHDVLNGQNEAAIAGTIVTIGLSLGLLVIAEGVETGEQRDVLAANGCRAYQGYYFAPPLPLPEFEGYLANAWRQRLIPEEAPAQGVAEDASSKQRTNHRAASPAAASNPADVA